MSGPLKEDETGMWALGPIDWNLVNDYSRRALKHASFEPDRRKQVHEGIALIAAGSAMLHSNGTFRHSAEAWVRLAFARIYGFLN